MRAHMEPSYSEFLGSSHDGNGNRSPPPTEQAHLPRISLPRGGLLKAFQTADSTTWCSTGSVDVTSGLNRGSYAIEAWT